MVCGTLGGCVLPPAVAVASYLSDGAVTVATGKSPSDLGMSLATGRDCRTWRLFKEENLCHDEVVAGSEAIPVEVAQDASQAANQIADMPVDDAARATLADRTLAAAFQPLAAGDAVATPLPRFAAGAIVARAAPNSPRAALLAHGGRQSAALAQSRPLPVLLAVATTATKRVAAHKAHRRLVAHKLHRNKHLSAAQWQVGHNRYQPSVVTAPTFAPAAAITPVLKPAPVAPQAAAPEFVPARSSSLWPQPVGPPAATWQLASDR